MLPSDPDPKKKSLTVEVLRIKLHYELEWTRLKVDTEDRDRHGVVKFSSKWKRNIYEASPTSTRKLLTQYD